MTNTIMHLPNGGGNQTPTRIIIHAMAEYIKVDANTAQQYHVKPGQYHAYHWLAITELSAHSLITPEGANIRARPDNLQAWHAKGNNTDTLGIEFLLPGAHDYAGFLKAIKTNYLTAAGFDAGVKQVRRWCKLHAIVELTTHHKIDPARKQDPGPGFPFGAFHDEILELIT